MIRSILLSAMLVPLAASAQLINGSFENDLGFFSLADWEWTCEDPQPGLDAPVGGGGWSARKEAGHAKGCFPNYLYQRLPAVQYGVFYQLSGWVKCPIGDFAICLGGSLGFGTISNGEFALAQNVTSSDTAWTYLTISHVFDPGVDDTAIVVLSSGFIGGPINPLPAGFDQLTLDVANSVDEPLPLHVSIFPDPTTDRLNVGSTSSLRSLEIFDATGRRVIGQRASGTTEVIDVTTLSMGQYLLKATTGEGTLTRRFVKQ